MKNDFDWASVATIVEVNLGQPSVDFTFVRGALLSIDVGLIMMLMRRLMIVLLGLLVASR